MVSGRGGKTEKGEMGVYTSSATLEKVRKKTALQEWDSVKVTGKELVRVLALGCQCVLIR